MERRYLVAAVAIVATFAGFSHGFRCLQRLSMLHAGHLGAIAKMQTDAGTAAAAMATLHTRLRPGYPEEAQLLAEMNEPIATMGVRAAQQLAKQNVAAAQCARATAMREAARARRDAMRMRDQMVRSNPEPAPAPISIQLGLSDQANQRIAANMAALASRLVAQQMRLQITAHNLQAASVRIAEPNISVVDTDYDDQDSASDAARAGCNHRTSETERIAREAVRDAMRQIEYSFNSK